ncbi:MAG: 2-C-methyl-D-erythritol 2,4-cyclodiphosphate synthase [Deltaproteobacteria bacterium]|nr:2-C-methyl-D-erythritol 2,4-cyclodiphosphate synthase [Deltaproteobacteria bacterium]
MSPSSTSLWAIIVAGGSGSRFGSDKPKQFLDLGGKSVLEHSLALFESLDWVEGVVLVLPKDFVSVWKSKLLHFSKALQVVEGGSRRQDSTEAGLAKVPENIAWVLVHDAARPLVTAKIAEEAFKSALKTGAAVAATPVADTLKEGDEKSLVVKTLSRESLYAVQTPQVFAKKVLIESLDWASTKHLSVTDEASLLEQRGYPVSLSLGSSKNFKITRDQDLEKARALLAWEERQSVKSHFRLGEGYDVHRLVEGRDFILGGVKIPFEKGLLGHSDADALFHAISDALLGALALGDLGHFFPDTDAKWKDANSGELLSKVYQAVQEKNFSLINLDATVICQRPKLAKHIPSMRENLAKILQVSLDQVSVKATTEESMGFTGQEEGIAVRAVVLLGSSLL